jgi:peptidoglycan-associated lipoprotein
MFDFDSTAIAEQDRSLLTEVARCFSEGPLRGQGLALTGRADPRGEDEYNMALGESRADSVRRYLRDLGVSPQKVQATSRGEIDATGQDEAGWALDRRVDIELASR